MQFMLDHKYKSIWGIRSHDSYSLLNFHIIFCCCIYLALLFQKYVENISLKIWKIFSNTFECVYFFQNNNNRSDKKNNSPKRIYKTFIKVIIFQSFIHEIIFKNFKLVFHLLIEKVFLHFLKMRKCNVLSFRQFSFKILKY